MAAVNVTTMQPPTQPTPPSPTSRELAEIEQAIDGCRGDRVAESRLTGSWMAHLLIGSARRPPRLSGLG